MQTKTKYHKDVPVRPCKNEKCSTSSSIADQTTFGHGMLDHNGYWKYPCRICAREYEKHSKNVWPFDGRYTPIGDLRILKDKISEELGLNGEVPDTMEDPVIMLIIAWKDMKPIASRLQALFGLKDGKALTRLHANNYQFTNLNRNNYTQRVYEGKCEILHGWICHRSIAIPLTEALELRVHRIASVIEILKGEGWEIQVRPTQTNPCAEILLPS